MSDITAPAPPAGFTAAPNALIADPGLSDVEFRVLMAALWFGADSSAEGCWASVASIGERAGDKCETSTRKTLQCLVAGGYLESRPAPSKLTRRSLRAVGKAHLDLREVAPRPAETRTPETRRPTPRKSGPRPAGTRGVTLRKPAPDQEGKELRSFPSVGSPSADAAGAPSPGAPTGTPAVAPMPPPPDPASLSPMDRLAADVAELFGWSANPGALAWVRKQFVEINHGRPDHVRSAARWVAADCRSRGVAVEWKMLRPRIEAENRERDEAARKPTPAESRARDDEAKRKVAADLQALIATSLAASPGPAPAPVPQEAV